MRKTSAYGKRIKRTGGYYNAAEWLNTLTKCRPYSEELIPGAINKRPSFEAIRATIVDTRLAFEHIKVGNGTTNDFEVLIAATGEAKVRFAQIAGNSNPAVDVLDIADEALMRTRNRFDKTGKWGFDGPALLEIAEGLDLYEDIATSSSPAQMNSAMLERHRLLIEQRNITA